ncbi:MAG: metallophosphoesterase family protein [Nitriliruptorales bacterium]
MRILHSSDWHVGRTIRGRSREAEHAAVLAEMLDVVEDEAVDLVLVAGDQFDSSAPPATAERLVWRTILGFADRGAAVVVVAGNHDHAARLDALAPVLGRRGDIVVGAHVRPAGSGGLVRVATRGGEAQVALVPFQSQRGIVKTADLLDRDAAQHAQAYAERVEVIVEALTRGFGSGDCVDLVLAHLTVLAGGTVADRLGGGERLSQIFDYVVPAQAFPANAHYVALGHLHQPHDVPGPAPVRYSGSPLHLDFGEVASDRGVTIVDAEPGTPAQVRHRPLRAGFRLLTLRGGLDEVVAAGRELDDRTYVRAVLDEAPRPGLADEVRAAVPQVVDVRLAERETADAAEPLEADEAAAADPAELFATFLDARGIDDRRLTELFRRLLDDVEAAGSEGEAETDPVLAPETDGEPPSAAEIAPEPVATGEEA